MNCPGGSGSCRSDFDELGGHELHFTVLSEQPNEASHCACGGNSAPPIVYTTHHDWAGAQVSHYLRELRRSGQFTPACRTRESGVP